MALQKENRVEEKGCVAWAAAIRGPKRRLFWCRYRVARKGAPTRRNGPSARGRGACRPVGQALQEAPATGDA
jgi:hypothetical protein